MKKRTIITLSTSIVIILIIVIATISYNSGVNLMNLHVSKEKEIEVNEWQPIKTAGEEELIKVVWDQKYGIRKTEYCKVVFENKKRKLYKLIAPGLEAVIEQSNINDIIFENILKDSLPK